MFINNNYFKIIILIIQLKLNFILNQNDNLLSMYCVFPINSPFSININGSKSIDPTKIHSEIQMYNKTHLKCK